MRIEEIESKLPGIRVKIGEIEIDPTRLVERACFDDRSKHAQTTCTDYRDQSIDYFVRHKVDFHSTCNLIYNVAKRFIVVKCPSCKRNMEVTSGGGGNNSMYTVNYCCTCGTRTTLTMPNNGFTVEFKDGVI
jgi:hypothetical protein